VGTAGNAAFNAGNKYWDPRLKASIYDHALDALLCIKTEAVGVPAYKFEQSKSEQESSSKALWSSVGQKAPTVLVTQDKVSPAAQMVRLAQAAY
jgi:hypothetical protein